VFGGLAGLLGFSERSQDPAIPCADVRVLYIDDYGKGNGQHPVILAPNSSRAFPGVMTRADIDYPAGYNNVNMPPQIVLGNMRQCLRLDKDKVSAPRVVLHAGRQRGRDVPRKILKRPETAPLEWCNGYAVNAPQIYDGRMFDIEPHRGGARCQGQGD